MSCKSFEMRITEKESLEKKGRLQDRIGMLMQVNGMDPNKPFEITDDEDRRRTIISQHIAETGDEEDQV